jgi:hypothetical protein
MFLNGLSVGDMDSLRTTLGILSLLTSQTDEITRKFQVKNSLLMLYGYAEKFAYF